MRIYINPVRRGMFDITVCDLTATQAECIKAALANLLPLESNEDTDRQETPVQSSTGSKGEAPPKP